MKRNLEVETEMLTQDLLVTLRSLREAPMNYLRRERGCLLLAEGLLRELNAEIRQSAVA
jgi:hypothetical protein